MSLFRIIFAVCFFQVAPQVFADGMALYTQKLCHTCHGVAGAKPLAPTFPKICGQNAGYIKEQAIYIRDGKRNTPMASSMKALVAAVTDEEFEKIAQYLEKSCTTTIEVEAK